MYSENFKRAWKESQIVILTCLLMLFLVPDAKAQEEDLFGTSADDSLLFGDEFDLGDEDISFDFEDDGEGESDVASEDDFFGEFEDEDTAAGIEEDSVSIEAEDDWGLESSDDYESLITRSADGEENPFFEEELSHPLDFRKYVRGTIFEGTGYTISLYSPQYVGEGLKTWYSYMDYSLTLELPWHLEINPAELSFSIDISSFSFDNSFPAGGDFKGVSVMPMAHAKIFGAEIELGMGTFYPTFGALAGIGYTYQFHSIFLSAGYRWNWAYNIDPVGSSWWLEPRLTTGIKLW